MSNLDYINQTESYIEKNRDSMPEVVYQFIQQVCKDEKRYIEMLNNWSKEKGVLKVPNPVFK